MKNINFYILLLLSVVALVSCKKEIAWVPDGYGAKEFVKPTTPYTPDQSFKRVAYFPNYRAYTTLDSTRLPFLTHVIYCFVKPKADGTVMVDGTIANMENTVAILKRHDVKVLFAMNGESTIYTTLLANASSRSRLIQHIVDFTLRYGFDGVDMDWEYPRADLGNDMAFGIFMKELGAELNSWHKSLSMAVTAGVYEGAIKEGINQHAIDACDFVNLMAYDAINAPPSYNDHHSTFELAERVLDVWLNEKGLPKEKAVLGLPLYGKRANNTAMAFGDLVRNGADPDKDEYEYNGNMYYYNGISTIVRKTELAKVRANGVMFWEFGQDGSADFSLIEESFNVSN